VALRAPRHTPPRRDVSRRHAGVAAFEQARECGVEQRGAGRDAPLLDRAASRKLRGHSLNMREIKKQSRLIVLGSIAFFRTPRALIFGWVGKP
jgi:hypothetical protein